MPGYTSYIYKLYSCIYTVHQQSSLPGSPLRVLSYWLAGSKNNMEAGRYSTLAHQYSGKGPIWPKLISSLPSRYPAQAQRNDLDRRKSRMAKQSQLAKTNLFNHTSLHHLLIFCIMDLNILNICRFHLLDIFYIFNSIIRTSQLPKGKYGGWKVLYAGPSIFRQRDHLAKTDFLFEIY